MFPITIKHSVAIQKEVDHRAGHTITGLTAMHICAVEYAGTDTDAPDEIDGQKQTAACVDAFALGVEKAMELARKAQKRAERLYPQIADMPRTFGIYVATQETGDGNDYLYFIGTPQDILAKLRTIPETD